MSTERESLTRMLGADFAAEMLGPPTHRADCEAGDCGSCFEPDAQPASAPDAGPRLVCHACGRAYARTPIGGMCRVKMCFGVVRVEGTE